jgi:hypothetical protein
MTSCVGRQYALSGRKPNSTLLTSDRLVYLRWARDPCTADDGRSRASSVTQMTTL